jgi:hypothetical protein
VGEKKRKEGREGVRKERKVLKSLVNLLSSKATIKILEYCLKSMPLNKSRFLLQMHTSLSFAIMKHNSESCAENILRTYISNILVTAFMFSADRLLSLGIYSGKKIIHSSPLQLHNK